MQKVSTEKFNALIKKSINLGECLRCGKIGAQIRIDFPLYGRAGAYCRCYFCGFETKRRNTHIVMMDSEARLGTPTIEKSFMRAVMRAINDWNRGIL